MNRNPAGWPGGGAEAFTDPLKKLWPNLSQVVLDHGQKHNGGMETYQRKGVGRRKPQLVQAMQVGRPYRKVQFVFPRSHRKDKPSGAIDYIRIIDAPAGRNRARDGDWIVKFPDGTVEVVPAEEFNADYTTAEAAEVGASDTESEALD